MTKETKKRISQAVTEANKKRIWTKASRLKISNSSKGRKQSAETIKKRTDKNRGQKRSGETKRKISLAKKGKSLSLSPEQKKKRSEFAKNRTAEQSSGWKGGRRRDTKGYIRIYMPTHPYANTDGYVFEHRLVMESHLGRILLPTEVVHHINGIPDDNRIENLMLFSNQRHHLTFHHRIDGFLVKERS